MTPAIPQSDPNTFQPLPPDESGSVTWIHIGDLHMKLAGEQNDVDLGRLVDVINTLYARRGVCFVYLPGDIADDGSASAYRIVRSHLDKLTIPWCGIVGDHDVHERSFDNFRAFISKELTSAFTIGHSRFLRLNAFSQPRPDAFVVSAEQLAWVERELQACEQQRLRAVLLLHCYPSDLKQGGAALTNLIHKYPVLLVDMGHTHYNELSNDGHLLYSATRSTGQIEEGPVGFSVITLDSDVVSWHFVRLDAPELVAITLPPDRRLDFSCGQRMYSEIVVRARVWSRTPVVQVIAKLADLQTDLVNDNGVNWSGVLQAESLAVGQYRLVVEATTEAGQILSSQIELAVGSQAHKDYAPSDQDNAIGAWPERGILGTQLGPNKNGRKW